MDLVLVCVANVLLGKLWTDGIRHYQRKIDGDEKSIDCQNSRFPFHPCIPFVSPRTEEMLPFSFLLDIIFHNRSSTNTWRQDPNHFINGITNLIFGSNVIVVGFKDACVVVPE